MTASEQVISVLDALCEKFGIVIDWTQQNILPYVQELMAKYIMYEIVTSIMWCLIPVLLGVAVYISFVKPLTKAAEELEWDFYNYFKPCAAVAAWILFIAIIVAGFFIIAYQVFDIAKCITIPEILELLTSLSE